MKYKADLNLHCSKQELANYFETFAPVLIWMAISFLLVLAILNHWSMRLMDFVIAYTQALIECKMYMTLPHGISTWHGHAKYYVLKLINNIYGQKQAGKVFLIIGIRSCTKLILSILFLVIVLL